MTVWVVTWVWRGKLLHEPFVSSNYPDANVVYMNWNYDSGGEDTIEIYEVEVE